MSQRPLVDFHLGPCSQQPSINLFALPTDFFRYGCPSHGRFGIGLNRLVMCLLGLRDVREATFLPPKREHSHDGSTHGCSRTKGLASACPGNRDGERGQRVPGPGYCRAQTTPSQSS